jgi:hypothetical protein
MTDIVERLRGNYMPGDWGHLAEGAAAEIERLTEEVNALRLVATAHDAEVERLRAALEKIASYYATGAVRLNSDVDVPEIARAALNAS